MLFSDRTDAGTRLGERLATLDPDTHVVCGIPRGGALVGARAAVTAGLSYECMVVCKIGVPCFPEVTLGAIDEDGDVLFDPHTQLTRHEVNRIGGSLLDRIASKVEMCRGGRDVVDLAGKTAVIVDEFVADPIVVLKARELAFKRGASTAILATPAIARDVAAELATDFESVVTLETRGIIRAPDDVYRSPAEPDDDTISSALREAWDAAPVRAR